LGYFNVIVHDPETSDLGINKYRIFRNPFLLILASIIPSSILGLIQVYQNTFLTALPKRVPQQITETAEAILSIFPADQEIWIPIAVAGSLISLFIWMEKTKKIDKTASQLLIYLATPILYIMMWTGVHFFHHGASDVAIQYVILFGAISSILLVAIRSVIPLLVFKITNNLYLWLNGFIEANETALVITIAINVLVIVLFSFILFATRKKQDA
jgi:hypothetical protein